MIYFSYIHGEGDMHMLKRAISALLAFVLVFGLIPVPAMASETEAATEPVLTEEASVPTTEAEQTVPVISVPETTDSAQTAASETAAAESEEPETEPVQTVPAVTGVPETVPAETFAEEAVPEETVPVETEPEQRPSREDRIPAERHSYYWYVEEKTHTYDRTVTEILDNGDGTYSSWETTETITDTYKELQEIYLEESVSTMSLREEGEDYYFDTFEDLKELAAMPQEDWYVYVYYEGEGPLVIEESFTVPDWMHLYFYEDNSSIVIPEGVTLTLDTWLDVNNLTVEGILDADNGVQVYDELRITGKILLDSYLHVDSDTLVVGAENVVVGSNWNGPVRTFGYVYTAGELEAVVNAVNSDPTGWEGSVTVATYDGAVTLDRSLVIPEKLDLSIYGDDDKPFIIAEGVTLTLYGSYTYVSAPLEVRGSLVNESDQLSIDTMTVTGSYSGAGKLHISKLDSIGDSLEDYVTGLDMDRFVVTDNGHYWVLRDVSSLTRLATPTDLAWNKRAIHKNGKVTILNAPGWVYWKTAEPNNDSVVIHIYNYDTDEQVYKTNCNFGGQSSNDRSLESFIEADLPSGTYYFTVTSTPRGNSDYYESLPAVSEPWTYTRPSRTMPQCTDLSINWPICKWTDPTVATENTVHQVEFYFSETEDGTPVRKGRNTGSLGTSFRIWQDVVNNCGAGWYSFRVRAIPDNINRYRLGDWAEMGEAFYYDPETFAYDETWILEHRGPHPVEADRKLTFTDVPIVLRNDFTVPSDMTLDIAGDGCITVPAGKTLTLNGDRTQIYNGGRLIVEEGGTLIVNSNILMYLDGGHIENRGEMIFNNNAAILNIRENGNMGGTTSGVPLEYVHEIIHLGDSSASYRETYLDFFESGDYNSAELYIHNDITLPDGFTIPQNGSLFVWRDAELTVPAGETLNVDGRLMIIENGKLTNRGTIKIGGTLAVETKAYNYGTIDMAQNNTYETGSAWINVWADAAFYNYGTVNVRPWATVFATGEWVGNYPNNNGGDVHGSTLSMTQAEFVKEVNAAKKAGIQFVLDRAVEIKKSLALDYQVIIGRNATVTVYNGATLTVNEGLILQNGADLLIDKGSKLKNNSYITSNATSEAYGTISVDGTYIHGKDAAVYIMQDNGTPAFWGIDEKYLTARYDQADEETLLKALELEGYGAIQVWTDSLELNTDITIPANMTLIINPTWRDLQNGTRNDWVKINSNVTVYGALNPNAYYNGTPCNLRINGNIDVMPGGNMYTCGNVHNNGCVRIHAGAYYEFNDSFGASWIGNQPIIDMTEADLRAKIKNGAARIELTNSITLTKDLVLPQNVSLYIYGTGALTVPEDVTLTMDGRNYIYGGQLIVEEGGYFHLNNDLHIYDHAVVDIQGKLSLGNYWSFICRKFENGWDDVTVRGVPLEQQAVNVFFRPEDPDGWEAAADVVENNIYGRTFMMVVGSGEVTMPRSMTLPEKTICHLDTRNVTFVIPEGMTLDNRGSIYVWPSNKLVNYGTLNNECYIAIYGRLDNYGTVNGYAATPDSQFTNEWSTIAVLPNYSEGWFNNWDTVNVYPHGEVFCISNWQGSDPVNMGGSVIIGRYQGDQDGAYLSAGKSLTLKVWDWVERKALAAKNVTWSLPEEYAPYATINAKGKLTVRGISEAVTIEAIATVKETGEEVITTIHLFPSVTQLEVTDAETGEIVNGKTVPVDFSETERSFSLNLYPLDLDTEVLKNGWCSWSISDKKKAFADYTIEDGILTVFNPTGKTGTVTVKVSYTVGTKKTVTFKLNFGSFAKSVEILNTQTELTSADKPLELLARVRPLNVTKGGVVWTLEDPADKAYVKLSKGKLTAKPVYGEHAVTLIATSMDGTVSEKYTITVKPADPGILVLKKDKDYVTKTTLNVDLNTVESITLTAENFTGGIPEGITWKSSKPGVAMVNDGKIVILKKGSATITAAAKDGRKAVVNLKISQMATSVSISGPDQVASGKSIKLTADVKQAANKKVTWTIEQGSEYARISSSGKLTASKDITMKQKVTVRATAKDGSGKFIDYDVYVRPIAQGVQIALPNNGVVMKVDSRDSWWFLSFTTIEAEFTHSGDQVDLTALVYPYYEGNDDLNAIQEVSWKTSSKKIATIHEDGTLNILKPGTVTITAAAKDGSGKKVSFKLKLVN